MNKFEYSAIGLVFDVKPVRDVQGNIVNTPTFQEGWHVNATGEVPESWLQYEIPAPETPLRKNAVQETRFFVFPDKYFFETLLPEPVGA